MRDYLAPFLVGVALVACMIVTFQIGRGRGYSAGYDDALHLPSKSDTVWRTDTHFVDRPVEVWRTVEKPVYFAVHDTQIVRTTDSVFVALERQRRGYSGEDYEAVVSGVDPLLESIKVFPKTAYIQNTIITRKRWSFGITAGPGVLYDGSLHGGVGVVAGLQYNF